VLYYAVRDSWPARVLRRRVLTLGAAALAALIVSLAALALQVMAVTGSFQSATNSHSLRDRPAHARRFPLFPPVYAAGLEPRPPTCFGVTSRIAPTAARDPGRLLFAWLMSHRYGALILWTLLAAGWVARERRGRQPSADSGRSRWPPRHFSPCSDAGLADHVQGALVLPPPRQPDHVALDGFSR